jgi:DNA-binding winged helix-turn-helix (wHTH) protein
MTMQDAGTLRFGPFRIDLTDERLWRQDTPIRLTHKAFAVLCCLVTRPGQLVTKDDLFQVVWPDVVVSESTLTGCVQEVRRALGDRARQPQFVETVHGRGYRFIAPVTATSPPGAMSVPTSLPSPQSTILNPPSLVGREAELDHLHQWYTTALQGRRQIGFIAGEAGIGKTALVETFMAQVAAENNMWLGRGQCVDHYGSGEAYLPVLEALGRLCRGPNGTPLITLLRQQAPSWLAQMPGLLSDAEHERLQRITSGATQTRMLRELAETLEMLTVDRLLVLILEDLHWSDTSTLEWLTYVARRRDPAHLLVLGTYRPADAMVREHPLRAVVSELEQHGQCDHLTLDYLSEDDVAAYVRQRFGAKSRPTGFTSVLHQHNLSESQWRPELLPWLRRSNCCIYWLP